MEKPVHITEEHIRITLHMLLPKPCFLHLVESSRSELEVFLPADGRQGRHTFHLILARLVRHPDGCLQVRLVITGEEKTDTAIPYRCGLEESIDEPTGGLFRRGVNKSVVL